jgi:hypothetical protein
MNTYQRALSLTASAALAALPVLAQESTLPTEEETVELEAFVVEELADFADLAIPGETPVSFTALDKQRITEELGSRDIPLILNTAPSVYASTDSGGAGDARVNVRGFNQRNVSILINGVPTNDIENGWLYWSNWDGIGDVSSEIQLQRGLSNVTLPTPSIGGTMNIITDPSASERGGSFKAEFGSDSFMKFTGVLNTGVLSDKFALTVAGLTKTGEGYANGLWTDGKGYYIGATWFVNDTNRLELYAIGAPQQHGQRTFANNIAAYDADFARSLGYSEADLANALRRGPVDAGHAFNQNYSPVSSSYTGLQYYWGSTHRREKQGFINERQNYFHKPQVNLNWYSQFSDTTDLATVFYYSGGRGGGSGNLYSSEQIYGFNSSSRSIARFPVGIGSNYQYGSAIDYDRTIEANAGTRTIRDDRDKDAGHSMAILRNSVNQQDQFGIVSKLSHEVNDNLEMKFGLDWRTAWIEHFREIRDLLGGDYYLPRASQASEFWDGGNQTRLGLGDKVNYHNTNTVDWLGLFTVAQYDNGPWHAFGTYAYSTIEYTHEDFFRRAAPGSDDTFKLNSGSYDGHQIKGGTSYKLNENLMIYGNAGWVSKVPIFDGVIDDVTGRLIDSPNEKYTSFEAGMRWESSDRTFNVSANLYATQWRERTLTEFGRDANDNDYIIYLRGVDSDHNGIEVEAAWQPNKWYRLDFAASYGDWTYVQDVEADAVYVDTGLPAIDGTTLYLKDLKVGDAPQTQLAYAFTVFPVEGLSIKFQGRYYDRYWSEFSPEDRTDSTDRAQPWQIPSYDIYDLHINYYLPGDWGMFDVQLFAHVFNIFDKTYVSDATDESSFESIAGAPAHSAQRAEAYLGAPLTYNMGITLRF